MNAGATGPLFHEDFDALGQMHGEFGLDMSPDFIPGLDDSTLTPGLRPAVCDPVADGCAGAVTRLVDLGGGDWALWTENWAFGAAATRSFNGIRGTEAFARGDNLTCTFRVFGDKCVPLGGEAFPAANGPFGPWHLNAGVADWETLSRDDGSLERDMELGMTFWSGWKHHFEENGTVGGDLDASGPLLAGPADGYRAVAIGRPLPCTAPNSDWAAQKASGHYWYRATLGNSTGGTVQTSTDWDPVGDPFGGTWTTVIDDSLNPIDTRGMPAGGAIGSAANVYLGFGAFKHTMIDDIYVTNDSSPVPAELSEFLVE
jgi:hypothetical protein